MVNSKKMSKSKVAIILLSLLLCLSMILTATGAWFTSSDSQDQGSSNEGQFGVVSVSATGGAATWTKLSTCTNANKVLPGSELTVADLTVTLSETSVKSYVYLTISEVRVYTGSGESTMTRDMALEGEIAKPTLAVEASDENKGVTGKDGLYTLDAGDTLTIKGGKLTITATTVGNEYQNKYIKVEYEIEVRAIQFDNVEDDDAYSVLKAETDGTWNYTSGVVAD